MIAIDLENVVGGSFVLLSSKDFQSTVFEHVLQLNEWLTINDRKVFHYVSPIVPNYRRKGAEV